MRISARTKCYLGAYSPDPVKVKGLQGWTVPNKLTNLRPFFGFAGYYRQYIRDYAQIAEPLHRTERKGTFFKWRKDCQKAFKEKVNHGPSFVLSTTRPCVHFGYKRKDIDGISSVLCQRVDGEEKVTAYAARS